ncbi:hypothetical protein BT67DRAFT_281717 [Trichocladium antarcticum]|uniref:Uncharacterized protein n=1 Tax=Trichocladium antarcticum TaxID=1450529 RepID=A0AAN6ULH9_9PEZI|nr:hypothetical protein BT67DRAFT_281717 [Trichocladium antarcticum]
MLLSGLGIPRPWSTPESPPPRLCPGPGRDAGLGSRLNFHHAASYQIGLGIPTTPKMPAPLFLGGTPRAELTWLHRELGLHNACRRTTRPGGSCSNDGRRTRPSRKARRLRVWIRCHGAYRVHGRREAGTGPWDLIGKPRFTGLRTAPRTASQSVNRPTYPEDPYPAPRW